MTSASGILRGYERTQGLMAASGLVRGMPGAVCVWVLNFRRAINSALSLDSELSGGWRDHAPSAARQSRIFVAQRLRFEFVRRLC
jgi:hypothetical protein